MSILKVDSLVTELRIADRHFPVVNDVSFTLEKGETLAIVGESGCGKSMLAMSLLRILPEPLARIGSGRILFDDRDLAEAGVDEMRTIRGKRMSIIFQDPMASLNPVETIGNQIAEMICEHEDISRRDARKKAIELLRMVRLPDAEKRVDEYPHRLSGGMCQRVMIAMALACRPEILIADEPTTALDVTIQAQILALLSNLQSETGAAVILITHNLAIVAQIADRLLVMYAGEIVESGTVASVFGNPRHPYTRQLIDAIPKGTGPIEGEIGRLAEIRGSVPALDQRERGCNFSQRCDCAVARCRTDKPVLKQSSGDHSVACFVAQSEAA
ncbi:ABC transporter ATP-binding protein [Oceanibacterium hippocampi]|uniref:Oligopeptide transport ATP-binding protein OppD n=1 Tax=Oceanibacterium hippocampi TaxID=745714 RepID=A0A1Y5RS95_9PROT|nr:ABC transporter ATP-binding protein [Oceanibacterium hippocampi]SLN24181.1 Oligopeptide transport ATP-binding protein OppD [Oceanibacterium hippocampi]